MYCKFQCKTNGHLSVQAKLRTFIQCLTPDLKLSCESGQLPMTAAILAFFLHASRATGSVGIERFSSCKAPQGPAPAKLVTCVGKSFVRATKCSTMDGCATWQTGRLAPATLFGSSHFGDTWLQRKPKPSDVPSSSMNALTSVGQSSGPATSFRSRLMRAVLSATPCACNFLHAPFGTF